jgi:DNA-binding transcriptional LysR family regulator
MPCVESYRVRLSPSHTAVVADGFRSGSIDLALGGQNPPSNSEFNFQKLFVEDFASVVRADHPITQLEFTVESYISWPHALITVTNSRMGYVDTVLERLGVERRILLRLPHFLAAPLIIARTDLVLILPRRLATLFAGFTNQCLIHQSNSESLTIFRTWQVRNGGK